MIEVAVIGAGSAGLVTAKHLLASGLRCCVFEAAATLGGAWSSSRLPPPEAPGAMPVAGATASTTTTMWKGLRTNLSKHTCRFSDFPWPDTTPTFPSKEDMDWYLQSYAQEFLIHEGKEDASSSAAPAAPACSFLYDCRVTKISPVVGRVSDDDGTHLQRSDQRYTVEWTDSVAQTKHSKEFGGVVLATGFFHKPNWPRGILPELERRKPAGADATQEPPQSHPMQILHSKDYVCHEDFAIGSETVAFRGANLTQPQTIAVAGASHSALEIAVDLTQSVETPVTIIMPKIPWVIPRYVPNLAKSGENNNGSGSNGFLPLDLALYQRSSPWGTVDMLAGLTPAECRKRHEGLRKLLGPRQDTILPVPQSDFESPPMGAVSDLFLDLVKDGKIHVVKGRLEGLTDDGTGLVVSRKRSSGSEREETETEILPGVTSLICCTGYSPDLESCCGETTHEEENYAPPVSILDTIQYDPEDAFCPMTTHLETLHPKLANLAFVGMYRGPYMGVVELQARLASQHLSGSSTLTSDEFAKELTLSESIRKQSPVERQQFPRFDYVGFLDSLTHSLSGNICFPTEHLSTGDMVTPAFYQSDLALTASAQADLEREIELGRSGHHLPGVVTSALVGDWSFERDIIHFASGGKSIAQKQYIHGNVNYSRSKDHGHVLYREDGLFEIAPSKSLPVFREYEYVSSEDSGALELFFVEGGKRTYLFLSLRFQHQDEDGYWVATNDHLCVKDLYKANFRIKLDGLAATEVIITYRVRGPSKDYESTTVMRPRL